ncbi:MAG TPA: hypothetical protein VF543_08095 [Pyrinomonadaceae bacterium]|jgi:hypothetical protein
MSIADAIAAAQLAVTEAEAAATLDMTTVETTATLCTTQATEAYQLAVQILKNKTVELAPVLIALEVAAINEGIAAYLAEETLAYTIEREVMTRVEAAFEKTASDYEADTKLEATIYQADITLEAAIYQAEAGLEGDADATVNRAIELAKAAAASALKVAGAGS